MSNLPYILPSAGEVSGKSINVKSYGAKGDGVTDDTVAFNVGLAALAEGQTLVIPTTSNSYIITSELTEPSVERWSIIGTGGKPIIDIDGIPVGSGLIPMTQRNSKIENIRIEGAPTGMDADANTSITDNLDGTYTVITTTTHNAVVGESVRIIGANPDALNGLYEVDSVTSGTEYAFLKVTGTGDSSASHGFTRYFTKNGILLGDGSPTANLELRDVEIIHCDNALIFDNCQDTMGLYSIWLVNNNIDILFEGTQSTSCRFNNCACLSSEQSVVINTSVTDIEWISCAFAARPYASDTYSKNFKAVQKSVYGMNFYGGRFEINDTNRSGSFWDNIYLEGPSTTFPCSNIYFYNTYFTGNAENHINLGRNVVNSYLDLTLSAVANNAAINMSDLSVMCSNIRVGNISALAEGADPVFSIASPLIDAQGQYKIGYAAKITLNKTLKTRDSGSLISSEDAGATRTITLPAATLGTKFAFLENRGSAAIFMKVAPDTGENFKSQTVDHIMTLGIADTTDTLVTIECFESGIWDYTVRYGNAAFGAT